MYNVAAFKHLPIPLSSKIITRVRQGAFGKSSHNEPGNEYNWDFEVPLGTTVLAVGDGDIFQVSQPSVGGCDPKYADKANNLKIKLADGSVAQYLHIETALKVGDHVVKGQVIAHTAMNGWLCYPHVHFGVYASEHQLYSSPNRKTVPIFFEDIPDGIAREGETYVVP
ncbi:MAG: M23 family metallopeptidase [Proteobacteria bacterium]|nr:M23 family metallopeptidase [Pseudomonadota bacterium]